VKRPDFSALRGLLDRVLERWDKAKAERRKKEELRRRADEILAKHEAALRAGVLGARDRLELADIMRVKDVDERRRRLVEFDERGRRPRPR